MNFNELKELAKKLGGLVVMNGNTPELVVLTYDNYKRLSSDNSVGEQNDKPETPEELEEIDRLNKEILVLKDEIRQREEAELVSETESDDVEG